ncbi:MAG: peptidyl-prolyl cis-trans isomerase [Sinobacteraceae bacterium]|nr:peptidyl-prolyl cis-trans isomerase [Nevskiaceae bacterium]
MNAKPDEVRVNAIRVDVAASPTPQLAAVRELLRQRACELGYLAPDTPGEDTERAIERVLAEDVQVPESTDEECRRWYEANSDKFRSGELACVRHILFQITPGAPVAAIRAKAEEMLRELRSRPELFEERARANSNCPSSEHGGNLGQLQRGETVKEFEKAVFDDNTTTGILPQLVTTRHGFHIVAVDKRIEGKQLPYAFVRDDVAATLRQRSEARALTQYVRVLAANAEIEGVELEAAASPLLQ